METLDKFVIRSDNAAAIDTTGWRWICGPLKANDGRGQIIIYGQLAAPEPNAQGEISVVNWARLSSTEKADELISQLKEWRSMHPNASNKLVAKLLP